MDTTATGTGRPATRRGMWVVLLWVGVAALLFLSGCVEGPSFAGDSAPGVRDLDSEAARTARNAKPAADEVILKWNGTLVVAEGPPAPRPDPTAP